MKTIKLIAALMLFLAAGLCMAQNSSKPQVTWKEPSTGFDSSDSAMQIKQVRFYKDRTEHIVFGDGTIEQMQITVKKIIGEIL